MPFDGYGVLSGTLHRHYRDQPDTQGRWFHINLEVDARLGRYQCAVDVDSKKSDIGVQWKVFTLDAAAVLPTVAASKLDYYDLPRTPMSGALDYLRHPPLLSRPGCIFIRQPPHWLQSLLNWSTRPGHWTAGSNLDAAEVFEPMLVSGRQILVFGEPFDRGLGMHNIHQNQGDPAGSQWWAENGIWQDGATLTRRSDGRFDVFLSKFSSQSDLTDDDGHPR